MNDKTGQTIDTLLMCLFFVGLVAGGFSLVKFRKKNKP